MNAQQLRNSILQEAIEGRLVPQDPNDEPASALLERIREEKRRLVKEGKLKKKDLVETPISEDEKPFEIPESWEWCRIKWLISGTNAGKSPNCQKRPKEGNEWGVLTTTSIQNGFFLPEENKVLPEKYLIENDYIVEQGDLLITRAGPKNRTGIVCVVNKNCENLILSDKTVRIGYIRKCCNPYYLMYILNSSIIRSIILQATVGMAESQVNISQDRIQNVIVPLPPLSEQKRIVAKIEELMPKVEEYGKAQEALDKLNAELPEKLKKSILQEAIEGRLVPQDPNDEPASVLLDKIRKEKAQLVKEGKLKKKDLIETPISEDEKPFEIPESWEWVRTSNVYQTSSGGTPEKGHPEYYGGSIPWVKVGDLSKIHIDKSEENITEEGLNNSSAKIFPRNTLLIAMYCNDAIGKSSILEIPMSTNQAICGLYPNKYIVTEYIYYVFQAYRKILQEQSAGGAQKNINQKIVNNVVFPLPPLAEQKRIVAKIEQLLGGIDKMKK